MIRKKSWIVKFFASDNKKAGWVINFEICKKD